ncbi:hypothetical protein KR222_005119 [Zaprionus bogoriensis]|nr:hypothetical protein KR222_005119 [Zaprionus bogoriensis]
MDRTVIAPWKAEEKEQSEKLHKKLQGLALLYPMNDELQKLLSWDMFLKPNQPAFFQVMHYLFRILDPVEFKRRFYWPITDKKSEANFRSSTVEYLKHLNEKHQLHWTNIKSYLVVMPGGMKFINFLLDLVGFVLQELIKQREKALSAETDISIMQEQTVHSMSRQNLFIKEYCSAYIEELNENTAKLRQVTDTIRKLFAEIALKTGVDKAQLLNDAFLKNFEAYNRRQCEQKITAPVDRIVSLEEPLCALKQAIDGFLGKQAEQKHNRETADTTLRSFLKLVGTESATGNMIVSSPILYKYSNIFEFPGNGERINALLSAFNGISETIAEQLDANDHYNESNEFVTSDLRALREQLQQMEVKGNDILRDLNIRARERNNVQGNVSNPQSLTLPVPSTPMRALNTINQIGNTAHPLLMKFVSTPPIKPETVAGVRNVNVRLPLQDDFNAMQFETTCNSLMVPMPARSARKLKPQQEQCSELNSTVNRSKIVDPMQLLRTINKMSAMPKATTQANISSLGSKWKQLQASFDLAEVTSEVPVSPKLNAISNYSPFTPLNCNERTRIERLPQPQLTDTSNNSSLYTKKSAAVMKVLDASINVLNLSTSPSGRLDALVPGPITEEQVLPRILLNDNSLTVRSQ